MAGPQIGPSSTAPSRTNRASISTARSTATGRRRPAARLSGCWYSWRHQIAALAPRFRAVAPDLRGYNLSDKPAGVAAYALPELVPTCAAGRGVREREAVIVGHDWGGAVAWTFAMEHPRPRGGWW